MPPHSANHDVPVKRAILIVDDHPILCRGLAALLESEPDLVVTGAVASGAAALEAIAGHPPDLVIVDLALDGSDGVDLIKDLKVRHPNVATLVLSMYDEALYGERCLRAGARGYVNKQQLDATILSAVRHILAGATYMSDALRARLAEQALGRDPGNRRATRVQLSDRELQVFGLLGEGRTTREIADRLGVGVKTVETHLERLKRKLQLTNAAQLAHHAARWVARGGTD
jgi:DNA-binding NarL/FixJ family response regulator